MSLDDVHYVPAENFEECCPGCGLTNIEQPIPLEPYRYHCLGCGLWFLVYHEDDGVVLDARVLHVEEPESNLVRHARYELSLVGEDPETVEGYLKVIAAFASMNHSGGSASVAIPAIYRLLQFMPLTPLTNDPSEWTSISDVMGEELWQSKRDAEAFSDDGGKSYWVLRDGANFNNRFPRYTALDPETVRQRYSKD